MKFKDYYEVLGVSRDASTDDIKKAFRKLAHKYHPDVSSDTQGEAKFKEATEAYATLKDPEKRAAYDELGRHPSGEEFQPSQGWQDHFGDRGFGRQQGGNARFDDVDLSDLFAAFGGGRGRSAARGPTPGQDFEVQATVTLEQVHAGAEIDIDLAIPETGKDGLPRRVSKTFRVKVPKGTEDGQGLRLSGKGGASRDGGPPGDLYIVLTLQPHPLYRVNGRDLSIDLPIQPWEAALGVSVEVPTLAGTVEMAIPAGTSSGRRLRLSKRGLPTAAGSAGDLYAIVTIAVPATLSTRERELYEELKKVSTAAPRAHFGADPTRSAS
jgi:curved DNA-binding protein